MLLLHVNYELGQDPRAPLSSYKQSYTIRLQLFYTKPGIFLPAGDSQYSEPERACAKPCPGSAFMKSWARKN